MSARTEGPLISDPVPQLTPPELRALLLDALAQLLTERSLRPMLDELLADMDYGDRPWQRFVSRPSVWARVTSKLADELWLERRAERSKKRGGPRAAGA